MKLFLFLDYDGTLTPIMKYPKLAVLSPKRRKILRKIARQPNIRMAVISGRKLSDVKKLVGISNIIYIGNHGFEIQIRGKHFVFPAAKRFVLFLKRIKSEIARKIKIKGILIEDKEFTLSIHYRLVPEHSLALFRRLLKRVIHPWKKKVRITEGKKVIEIRPSFDWDKGKAVKWIINKLNLKSYLPIYIGDDQTDEDAFRALKGKGIAIMVRRVKNTLADIQLKNINMVYEFIQALTK